MMGNCDFSSFHWMNGGWAGHWFWILLLAVAAGVTIWFLFARGRGRGPAADRSDSLEILKVRLGKGEITVDEYNTLKGVL